LDDDGRLFAQIRKQTVDSSKENEMLPTGEMCENYDETRKNIVREIGRGVQECTPARDLCPKDANEAENREEADPDMGIDREGCCKYKFTEWGACRNNIRTKGILELEFAAPLVPCYGNETIEANNLSDPERIRSMRTNTFSMWETIVWETC
jgi:hypothetical protein